MSIIAITYPVTLEHFGDMGVTEYEAEGFRVYMGDYLRDAFPDAQVNITENAGPLQVTVDDDDDDEEALGEVQVAIELAGNACKWEWVVPTVVTP